MTVLYTLVGINIVITPVILILLLSAPILDRKYTAVGRYYLWIVVMAALVGAWMIPGQGLLQINMPQMNAPVRSVTMDNNADGAYPRDSIDSISANNIPGQAELLPQLESEVSPEIGAPTTASGIGAVTPVANYIHYNLTEPQNQGSLATRMAQWLYLYRVLLTVWLAGAAISLGIKILTHISFRRYVTRWGIRETNSYVLDLFNTQLQNIGIVKRINLIRCKRINSPMLVGLVGNIHPTLLLPYGEYNPSDMELIFNHELIHYKRRDLWYKLALMVVQCLYWFNPAVFLMARQANKDIEDICDMLTVQGLSREARKCYGSLILEMALSRKAVEQPNRTQLSTCMNGGKKEMKQRFNNILGKGKKRGIILFSAAGVVIVLAAVLIGFNFAGAGSNIDNPGYYEPDSSDTENNAEYQYDEYESATEPEDELEADDEFGNDPDDEPGEETPEADEDIGFVMPSGYEWLGTYNPYIEETLRVTLNRQNIAEMELTPEMPINYIHIDFPMTVHIIQGDEDFVRISANPYLLESLNISLENGALVIEPPNANIFYNRDRVVQDRDGNSQLDRRDMRDFTAVYVGVSQYMYNIIMMGLYDNDVRLPEPLPVEPNAVNLHIRNDNRVHLDVSVSLLRMTVTDVYDIIANGEAALLELTIWGQSKQDISIAGIREASLNLHDHGENPGEYDIRVFVEVADLVEINGTGNNPMVWIMFSEPEVIDNHEGEVDLTFWG